MARVSLLPPRIFHATEDDIKAAEQISKRTLTTIDGSLLTVTFTITANDLSKPDKISKKVLDLKITEIIKTMCAFMNDPKAEKITLCFDESASEVLRSESGPKYRDDLLKKIEQTATELLMGHTYYVDHFNVDDSNTDRIVLTFNAQYTYRYYGFPFALNYHYHLPTQSQAVKVTLGDSPCSCFGECVSGLEDETTSPSTNNDVIDNEKEFTLDQRQPNLQENEKTQFKLLNDATSEKGNVTLADRMVNEGNKLSIHAASFANHKGGRILYGVDDKTYKGKGEKATVKEREKIKKKVDTTLSKILWPEKTKQKMKEKKDDGHPWTPWSIDFVPVNDKDGKQIPHTYVIVITVMKCPGGVFVKEPESYYFVDGKVVKMPFSLWRAKFVAYFQALKSCA